MPETVQPVLPRATPAPPGVAGMPRVWLRLEGVAILILAIVVYGMGAHSWVLFAALFFVPDLSMLGYLLGPRIGAVSYNLVHSYVAPAALGLSLHAVRQPIAVPLIWAAHIGFDRMLGYGLKYATAFGHTHLGAIGRKDAE